MKKLLTAVLLLAACTNTEGISPASSKKPEGNPNSTLVVEEFTDLQCPACRKAHTEIVKPLLEEQGNNIRFEIRHFPLRGIHPFAQEAAEAAECAADQGKFRDFVDDTFANQSQLSRASLISRAEKIGVEDIALFRRCVKSRIKRKIVNDDYNDAIKIGLNSTPTFMISGNKVARNTLPAVLDAIRSRMEKQKL